MTQPINVFALVRRLLDGEYARVMTPVLNALASSVNSGVVDQRLRELQDEAARLREAGERLTPGNPVLRALLADLDPLLRRNAGRIDVASEDLQISATEAAQSLARQLALPGLSDEALAQLGVVWNQPDAAAVAQLVDYVNSDAFGEQLSDYPADVLTTIRNQAVRGIAEGWNPVKTAEAIRKMAQGVPLAQAQTIARTLQLTSYRDATALQHAANADIITRRIRIAALDRRTCLACVALHGSVLEDGERVRDHHNGRCTEIAEVVGNPRNIQRGADWFAGLPESRQREQRSFAQTPAKFEAYKDGALALDDFVTPYDDDVFGEMVRENSLKGVLGDGARDYYRQK